MRKLATTFSLAFACLFLGSCQTLSEISALSRVNFDIDRVSNAFLAGVDVDRVRNYGELGATDIARLGSAIASRRLPFEFTLHLGAENPSSNNTQARLVEMDWTLFLEDRETVSGTFQDNLVLPAGQRSDVPIPIRLDLAQFFGNNLRDIVELALSVSGRGGEPKDIRLEATPVIQTSLGPIRYPRPISINVRGVGQ